MKSRKRGFLGLFQLFQPMFHSLHHPVIGLDQAVAVGRFGHLGFSLVAGRWFPAGFAIRRTPFILAFHPGFRRAVVQTTEPG
jgi:hypothetical protein